MLKSPSLMQRALPLALLSTAIAIAGCSSSSDSSSSADNNTPPPAKTISVTGVATKGILQGALVEACISTDCSDSADPIASSTTKADGSYELGVTGAGDKTIVIRVRHQAGAKMVCDVADGCGTNINFGDLVDMEQNLTLRSVTHVDSTATKITGNVTPLTELVTVAAIQSSAGQLSPDAITQGSTAVKTLLGLSAELDLIGTKPIDITKAEADVSDTTALLLSALSAAFADTSNGSIQEKIANIAKAVSGDSASVSVSDLVALTTSAKSTLDEAAKKNDSIKSKAEAIKSQLDTAKEKATENCQDNVCDVEIEESNNAADIRGTNAKAVKALVEDVRALGWEVYPALRDAADPDSDNYKDNLIGQADEAAKIIDGHLETAVGGLAELTEVFFYAYTEKNTATDIKALAKAFFTDKHHGDWQYTDDYLASRDDWYNDCLDWSGNNVEYCNDLYPPALTLEDAATAYANQFDGTISKSGKTWTANNAIFTAKAQDPTQLALAVTFPTAQPTDKANAITAKIDGESVFQGTTFVLKGDASAKFSADVSIASPDGNFFITEAKLSGAASIANTQANVTRTFEGKFSAEGGTPAAQQGKNQVNTNKADSFLPKFISIEGKFTSSNLPGSELSAKVSASLDNYDSYSYYTEGAPVNVPAKLTLSDNNKKLALSLGNENNSLSYSVALTNYQQCVGWDNDDAKLGYTDANGVWHKVEWKNLYLDEDGNRVTHEDQLIEWNDNYEPGYYEKAGEWVAINDSISYYLDAEGNKVSSQDVNIEWNNNYEPGYYNNQGEWQALTYDSYAYIGSNGETVNGKDIIYTPDDDGTPGYYKKGDWRPLQDISGYYTEDGEKLADGIYPDYPCNDWEQLPAIQFSECTIKGKGHCTWESYDVSQGWSDGIRLLDYYDGADSLTANSTILDALNVYLGAYYWNREYFYSENIVKDNAYGLVKFPILDDLKLSQFDNGVYETKAVSFGDPIDTASNFIKATITAEVTGKLSASLPEVNLKLTAKRSEFAKAEASLVVVWKENNKDQKALTIEDIARGDGSLDNLGKDNLIINLSHINGAKFLLSESGIDASKDELRFIIKDGTKYATNVRNDSMKYVVIYHYNDKGEKVNSNSLEFESLF